MSIDKEFEALEPSVVLKFVDDLLKRYENETDYNIYITKEWLLEIKQALNDLKDIKESEPSKAMEELNEIIEYITEDKKVKYKATILFDCEIIKDTLLKAQEQEKENAEYKEALRIIFEKNVDINYLKYNTLHDYNCHILARDRLDTKNQLTQEEFDLLKRYFEKNIQKARLR